MDQRERQVIDGLFEKIRSVGSQSQRREPEAEAHIDRLVASIPGAPYYMAQALLVQEQALANLQARTQELERQLAERPAAGSGGGGFLSSIFGGGQPAHPPPAQRQAVHPGHFPQQHAQQGGMMGGGYGSSPWGGGRPGGGGFLAGAMQTALGVAGGMLVADAISDAFSGPAAEAGNLAEGLAGSADQAAADLQGAAGEAGGAGFQDAGYEEPGFDAGGDFGGDFGGDETV